MLRYVQSHTIPGEPTDRLVQSRDAGEPYDGITEVWLSGDTPPEKAEASRAAGARLLQDESTFIDFARSTLFLTREHTIF
jgi:ribonuclease BN (tRNA processing enzyme)